MNQAINRSTNRWTGLLLALLALFSLSLFMIPAYVIRPFTHQSAAGLRLAIAVKRIAPLLTLAALAGVLALGMASVAEISSWGLRTGIVVALILSTLSAVMVRQNYFEWMFHPITAAGFISPSAAHLDDKEMVMVVRIGQESRAYPILQMAYHHILNDTVAEVPIVVTY